MVKLLERLARATGVTEHNTKPCHFFVLWLMLLFVHGKGWPASVSARPVPDKEPGEPADKEASEPVVGSKVFRELEIDWSR